MYLQTHLLSCLTQSTLWVGWVCFCFLVSSWSHWCARLPELDQEHGNIMCVIDLVFDNSGSLIKQLQARWNIGRDAKETWSTFYCLLCSCFGEWRGVWCEQIDQRNPRRPVQGGCGLERRHRHCEILRQPIHNNNRHVYSWLPTHRKFLEDPRTTSIGKLSTRWSNWINMIDIVL